jgi:hypothetical protein
MDRTLQLRIWMSCFAALLSCIYVYLCSSIAVHILIVANIVATAAIQVFLPLQKFVFIIPFLGIVVGSLFHKIKKKEYLFLVPDILYGFALTWIFVAMFLWLSQFSWRLDLFLNR